MKLMTALLALIVIIFFAGIMGIAIAHIQFWFDQREAQNNLPD